MSTGRGSDPSAVPDGSRLSTLIRCPGCVMAHKGIVDRDVRARWSSTLETAVPRVQLDDRNEQPEKLSRGRRVANEHVFPEVAKLPWYTSPWRP